jgi:putative peptidoglycan lipid II flippase
LGIIRNAFTVGTFTLFSRIIGFIRECVMVFCLGAGIYSDAILVALRVSNTFRRIFAEGAFNASFLPRFSKILDKDGKNEANVVLSDVFSVLLLILIPFSVIIIAIFPSFLRLLVSGFDVLSEKFRLTVALGRICFPYLIFISIASLFSGVLNTINKFALPAVMYSLLSIFTTSGLLIGYFFDLSNRSTTYVVICLALLSGAVQFGFLFASVSRHGFRISPRLRCWTSRVKDIMRNTIPGIIGAGVWQLNLLLDTTVSSYLPTGTITCLNLADRLNQFPLGTLGIALSTALMPPLSHFLAHNEYSKAMKELEKGLLLALFLTLFATSVLIALDEQSVAVAFQRGLFGAEQVRVTAAALSGFAIGLPAYVVSKVFSALYFASGDTKLPVLFGALSVVLNALFLLLLIPFWKYFGLALCTSLSAIFHASLLIYFAGRKMPLCFTKAFWRRIISYGLAALVTYALLRCLVNLFWYPDIGTKTIKWTLYSVFLVSAALAFLLVAAFSLYLTLQPWKLWTRSAWSIENSGE